MTKKKVSVEKLRDKNPDLKKLFWKILEEKKDPEKLNKIEIAALIARAGYLDDEERKFYNSVLIRSNLTEADVDRYAKLGLLDRYFPEKKEKSDGD